MAGGNWDDESDDSVSPAPAPVTFVPAGNKKKGKFADEDESDDDVKDSWDASDSDSEDEAPKKPVTLAPVRQKGITKLKIAEKEAEESLKRQQQADDEDPATRKQREKEAMLQADLDNAAALFGISSIKPKPEPVVKVGSTSTGSKTMSISVGAGARLSASAAKAPEDFLSKPRTTKSDFNALAITLSKNLIAQHSKSNHYSHFVETLTKALVEPLKETEVRRLVNQLTEVAKDKQKGVGANAAVSDSKKKRPNLNQGSGPGKNVAPIIEDARAYEDAGDDYDEYDDFM